MSLVDFLKYGPPGLAAVLAVLSFWILQARTKEGKLTPETISLLKYFMNLAVVLFIVSTVSVIMIARFGKGTDECEDVKKRLLDYNNGAKVEFERIWKIYGNPNIGTLNVDQMQSLYNVLDGYGKTVENALNSRCLNS